MPAWLTLLLLKGITANTHTAEATLTVLWPEVLMLPFVGFVDLLVDICINGSLRKHCRLQRYHTLLSVAWVKSDGSSMNACQALVHLPRKPCKVSSSKHVCTSQH